MSPTEQELVTRLKAGDSGALGDLFVLHRNRLRIVFRARIDRRLLGRIDVEDLLQDTYLAAAQRLDHYRASPTPNFFLWLRLVAVQTVIDIHRHHLKTQRRDANRDVSLARHESPRGSAPLGAIELLAKITSPSMHLIRTERNDLLEQVLDDLPDVDREILVLRHFEELSNSEISEVLGLSPQAASIRYIRALKRLRGEIGDLSALESLSKS